ncbi:MAG: CoA transferase, partial [Actinomycetota bacterium]
MGPDRPLTGLRVVDTVGLRGELCGRLLADLGAEVVRVEPPGGGPTRAHAPSTAGESLAFAIRNMNKTGAVLDLSGSGAAADADRERFRSMLAGADVWVDDARPGERDVVELDPESVSAAFPRLTITSITDFGHTGPYRDRVATNDVMVGMAWMLFKAGTTEWPPVLPPGSLAYDIAGITAAFATIAGHLRAREKGQGGWIDCSVMESVAQTTDWGLAGRPVDVAAGDPDPAEIRSGAGPVYPIVRCADGWVRPSVVSIAEWHKMREWLGDPPELQ